MKITVTVKPNAKKTAVEKLPDGAYKAWVKAPPVEGKANEAVIAALADFFKIRKSAITLIHGTSGKKKIFEIG